MLQKKKFLGKIVLMGVNFGFLVATLILPNETTPYAILPFLISAASWIFSINSNRVGIYLGSLIVTIVGSIFCALVGFACNIEQNDKLVYVLKFKGGTILANAGDVPYWIFAVTIFLISLTILICDGIASFRSMENEQDTEFDFVTSLAIIDRKVSKIIWR